MDAELVESAAVLTAIGMGTAFALLVGLLVIVLVLTRAVELRARFEWPFGKTRAEREARNRAIAATVAVGALLARRDAEEGE